MTSNSLLLGLDIFFSMPVCNKASNVRISHDFYLFIYSLWKGAEKH